MDINEEKLTLRSEEILNDYEKNRVQVDLKQLENLVEYAKDNDIKLYDAFEYNEVYKAVVGAFLTNNYEKANNVEQKERRRLLNIDKLIKFEDKYGFDTHNLLEKINANDTLNENEKTVVSRLGHALVDAYLKTGTSDVLEITQDDTNLNKYYKFNDVRLSKLANNIVSRSNNNEFKTHFDKLINRRYTKYDKPVDIKNSIMINEKSNDKTEKKVKYVDVSKLSVLNGKLLFSIYNDEDMRKKQEMLIHAYERLHENYSKKFQDCNNVEDVLKVINYLTKDGEKVQIFEDFKRLTEEYEAGFDDNNDVRIGFMNTMFSTLDSDDPYEKYNRFYRDILRYKPKNSKELENELKRANKYSQLHLQSTIKENWKLITDFAKLVYELDSISSKITNNSFIKTKFGKTPEEFLNNVVELEDLEKIAENDDIIEGDLKGSIKKFSMLSKDLDELASSNNPKNSIFISIEQYINDILKETTDENEIQELKEKLEICENYKNLYNRDLSKSAKTNLFENIDLRKLKWQKAFNEEKDEDLKNMIMENGLYYDKRFKHSRGSGFKETLLEHYTFDYDNLNDFAKAKFDEYNLTQEDIYTQAQAKFKLDRALKRNIYFDRDVKAINSSLRDIKNVARRVGMGSNFHFSRVASILSGVDVSQIRDYDKFKVITDKYIKYLKKIQLDAELLDFLEYHKKLPILKNPMAFLLGLLTGETQTIIFALSKTSILSDTHPLRVMMSGKDKQFEEMFRDCLLVDKETMTYKDFPFRSRFVEVEEKEQDEEVENEKIEESVELLNEKLKEIKKSMIAKNALIGDEEDKIFQKYETNTYKNINEFLKNLDDDLIRDITESLNDDKVSTTNYKEFFDINGFDTDMKIYSMAKDLQISYAMIQALNNSDKLEEVSEQLRLAINYLRTDNKGLSLAADNYDLMNEVAVLLDRNELISKLDKGLSLDDRRVRVSSINMNDNKIKENVYKIVKHSEDNLRKQTHLLDIYSIVNNILSNNGVKLDEYTLKNAIKNINININQNDFKNKGVLTFTVTAGLGGNKFTKTISSEEKDGVDYENQYILNKFIVNVGKITPELKEDISRYVIENNKKEIITLILSNIKGKEFAEEKFTNNLEKLKNVDDRTNIINFQFSTKTKSGNFDINSVDIKDLDGKNGEISKSVADEMNEFMAAMENIDGEVSLNDFEDFENLQKPTYSDITVSSLSNQYNILLDRLELQSHNNVSKEIIEKVKDRILNMSDDDLIKHENNDSYEFMNDYIKRELKNAYKEVKSDYLDRGEISDFEANAMFIANKLTPGNDLIRGKEDVTYIKNLSDDEIEDEEYIRILEEVDKEIEEIEANSNEVEDITNDVLVNNRYTESKYHL